MLLSALPVRPVGVRPDGWGEAMEKTMTSNQKLMVQEFLSDLLETCIKHSVDIEPDSTGSVFGSIGGTIDYVGLEVSSNSAHLYAQGQRCRIAKKRDRTIFTVE